MIKLIHKSRLFSVGLVFVAILLVATTVIFTSKITFAASGKQSEEGRLITIYDRGVKKTVLSQAGTVGDVLKETGIKVSNQDLVEPKQNEKLVASSYKINIYRARPVIIVDGNIRLKIVTPYQTAEQIAKSAGIVIYPEDETTIDRVDNLVEGAGLQLTIKRATPITFVLYGKVTILRTRTKTVSEMLKEKGIKLAADDTLSVPVSQLIASGETIELWRNGKQTINVDEDIPFAIEQIQDADQSIGYKQVQTLGVLGKKTATYEIEMKNGIEVSRTEIQSVVVVQPVKQIEVVGAKNNYSNSLSDWLTGLRSCETSGDYAKNTGNGYYGAYQFLKGTWNSTAKSIGRTDLVGVQPNMASPADQDAMIIANTNLSKGGLASQNPGCYKKLGLSQFPPKQ